MNVFRPSTRQVAATVLVAGAAALMAIVMMWVPWSAGSGHAAANPNDYFTSAQLARAKSYSAFARAMFLGSLALSTVATAAIGFTAVGHRLIGRLPGPWWLRTAIAVFLIGFGTRVLTIGFAMALWRCRVSEGLSTQTWAQWLRDIAVNELVAVIVLIVVLVTLLGTMRISSTWWPALAGVALGSFVMIGSFVYPVVIEPLSNNFTTLEAGPLRTEIMDLADREEVRVDDILVADASRRTTSLNAYVSGFGDTKRIVLYDNLLAEPTSEVVTVVAHELAHAKFDDVFWGSLLGAFGAVAGCGLLGVIVGSGHRWSGITVHRAPWLLAVVAIATILVAPVQNGISRAMETRADVVALEATKDPESFVDLQVELALRSLADPSPPRLFQWWWGTHPGTMHRIGLVYQSAWQS